jgi:riboflavin synthase
MQKPEFCAMFTGIIEKLGTVESVEEKGSNRTFWIDSPLSASMKVDQSVSHNGVCLTVEEVAGSRHRVTAVEETLLKTALNSWEKGTRVNLERSLLPSTRVDGHFVQGHVDATGRCENREDRDGSFVFTLSFPPSFAALVIEKGSIALNGISLTAFNVTATTFQVAIIPYTYEHTNLHQLQPGMEVNLEFDMLGKYILRKLSLSQ